MAFTVQGPLIFRDLPVWTSGMAEQATILWQAW